MKATNQSKASGCASSVGRMQAGSFIIVAAEVKSWDVPYASRVTRRGSNGGPEAKIHGSCGTSGAHQYHDWSSLSRPTRRHGASRLEADLGACLVSSGRSSME